MMVEEAETPIVRFGGARTLLTVPMLKDNEFVGAIGTLPQEVRPFTEKQIELVTDFAAQAVIAIENTRLLSELRAIAGAADGDGGRAARHQLVARRFGAGVRRHAGKCHPDLRSQIRQFVPARRRSAARSCASGSLTKAWDEQWRVGTVLEPDTGLQAFQTVAGRQPIQVLDLSAAPAYLAGNPKAVNSVEVGGIRTMLTVPMLKDGEAIGVITVFRTEVRAFTDKQIALVTSFAAQAVIAIENTRLLSELRESLAQQTATADVLSVISSSPGDLQPVFNAMLENGARLCEAQFGNLLLREGEMLRISAMYNMTPEFTEAFSVNRSFAPVRWRQ